MPAIPDCVDRDCRDIIVVVRPLFEFPDPVNETSARVVAAGVVIQAVLLLVVREGWLFVPLVAGFLARVATGPTLSPLGRLSVHVATPLIERRIGPGRRVPGPPKRFAQGIGLAVSGGAALAWALGAPVVTVVLLAGLIVAASLEAGLAICLGCVIYDRLWGCPDCADIGRTDRSAVVASSAVGVGRA